MKTKLQTILVIFFLINFLNYNSWATIRYVSTAGTGGIATPTGNGLSWATASSNLQAMINASVAGDEIWITRGLYKPAGAFCNGCQNQTNDYTFYIFNKNITLYGGFAGTETAISQRNFVANRTIFSGDVDNNDTNTDGNNIAEQITDIVGTNANHILTCYEGSTVDGIIFTAGNANNTAYNIQFRENNLPTNFGYVVNGQRGGAISTLGRDDLGLNTTTFIAKNCVFEGNQANVTGGAIHDANINLVLDKCVFSKNQATEGSAVYMVTSSISSATNCVFVGNNATDAVNPGGAISLESSVGTANLYNNTFSNNTGAGVRTRGNNITVIFKNNIFWGNLNNDLFRLQGTSANASLENNILQNAANTVGFSGYGSYNLIGGNKFQEDPLFVASANPKGADGLFFTADDGLNITCISPAINGGTLNGAPPATDILGKTRGLTDQETDTGAYESSKYTGSAALPFGFPAGAGNNASTPFESVIQIDGTVTHYITDATDCTKLIAGIQGNGADPVGNNIPVSAKVWTSVAGSGFASNRPWVKRRFEITPDNNPTSKTGKVFLYFTQADFDTYNSTNTGLDLPTGPNDAAGIDQLKIKKYAGISYDNSGRPITYTIDGTITGTPVTPTTIDPADADIKWDATNQRWEVAFDVIGFSGFFVVAEATLTGPLPVSLISFSAKNTEKGNELTWKTANEKNFSHFEIERSTNAMAFEKIGKVWGTKEEIYEFSDEQNTENPLTQAYYRLKMVDIDGSADYSKVISVYAKPRLKLSIYPNPASEYLNLEISLAIQTGRLLNQNGTVVQQFSGKNINIQHLLPGQYYLELFLEKGEKIVQKFIKQ